MWSRRRRAPGRSRRRSGRPLVGGATITVSSGRRTPLKPSPKTAMIRNGPRTRLRIAPGRRRVSMSSLPTKASSRTITARSGRIRRPRRLRCRDAGRGGRARRGSRRPRRTTAAPPLADGHLAAAAGDRLDDLGQRGRRVVDRDPQLGRSALLDAPDHRQRRQSRRRRSAFAVLDLDDVAAHRLAPQVVGRAERDEPAARDERDGVALLGLVDVLRGHQQRPAVVAQAMQLVPDRGPQHRVDAGGRLVEEQQLRVVDEGARRARGGAACRPTGGRRAGRGRPTGRPARGPRASAGAGARHRIPNSDATKSTFSRAVRSGYSVNGWGM